MTSRLFTFVGGSHGQWQVLQQATVVGESLAAVNHLEVVAGFSTAASTIWTLSGITSNERYVTWPEKQQLLAKQEGLGRAQATRAAFIPIRKNAAWWQLTQDERRAILEEQSQHIQIGLKYLPQIARRLHHCRDLSEQAPFDFLTWFEYAPEHESLFDDLLAELRGSPEWNYIDREIDLRLSRSA